MVQEIHSFEKYKAFINTISEDTSLKDPHFEYDENNLYGSLKKTGEIAYITKTDKEITGLYIWLILPEDKYIEMIIGLSNREESFEEMLTFIEANHEGYQLDFVINPRNDRFIKILKGRNAIFEEEQQWLVCENSLDNLSNFEIIPVLPEYKEQYIDKHRTGGYWTAEKVLNATDKFRPLLAIHQDAVIGYIDVTYCFEKNEIYDLWVDESFIEKGYVLALLQTAIKMNQPNKLMVLVDVNDKTGMKHFISAGFIPVEGTNSIYASYIC